ncbi:Cytochrome oxidase assembly [Coemansia nantahalensis]|uniref:Cytochrome oxidase assembly n=2 Tax=Coemansia TaxID=4863 RepID=A0ACC1KMT3_9FUNG|nr:Cytochrome oxidase assembly [Coemansia nantahalensis]KAJ2792011.1 Cytochrome oxidase assembly [Coemansia helicoidea]
MHEEIRSSQWVRRRRMSRMQRLSNKHPFLCVGLPFLVAVVGGSFVLLPSQQTKYELQDKRVRLATLEEAKGERRKFNIQEEYFRMQTAGTWGEWEPKRVARPPEEEPVFDRHDKK